MTRRIQRPRDIRNHTVPEVTRVAGTPAGVISVRDRPH